MLKVSKFHHIIKHMNCKVTYLAFCEKKNIAVQYESLAKILFLNNDHLVDKQRRIEVPTDTPTEFTLGNTAADVQRRREEREQRASQEEAQKQQRGQRGRKPGGWTFPQS